MSASLGDTPMPVGGQVEISALSRKAFGRSIITIRSKALIGIAQASGQEPKESVWRITAK